MAKPPIRVFLAEDSPIARKILEKIITSSPDLEIVGMASNGLEALEQIPKMQPDVICTDLHMPKMSGLELTRLIMTEFPRPILVISASVQSEDRQNVFQLLQAGALDVFPKPTTGLTSDYERSRQDLIHKIKLIAGVKVFTHRRRPPATVSPQTELQSKLLFNQKDPGIGRPGDAGIEKNRQDIKTTSLNGSWSQSLSPQPSPTFDILQPRVLAIGASTGGPMALHTIFQSLPKTLPVPILCVQHISPGFLLGLVNWLNQTCELSVQIAQFGQKPQPGTVYFAPEDHHLDLDSQGTFRFSHQPAIAGHRPSVTALFQAVARVYRRSSVGVLLTGMGKDGAEGLTAIADGGGLTIAQDEETSIVFGMPKEAIALGAVQKVLPLPKIAPFLLNQVFK